MRHLPRIEGLVTTTAVSHEATVKFGDGSRGLVTVDRKLSEILGQDPEDLIIEEADRMYRDKLARRA
jgi:hypothetical protein